MEKETHMQERRGVVHMKGKPLTLLGQPVKVGEQAPDFVAVERDLRETRLTDFSGQAVLISVVPSLDTPVCEMQTRRFNQEVEKLPQGVAVVTISMDLPFAQSRFCSTFGVERLTVLSDHREASFGLNYGLLIKELRLLARGTIVLDKGHVIRHMEIVPELTEHPDYNAALEAVRRLA